MVLGDALHRQETLIKNCKPTLIPSRKTNIKNVNAKTSISDRLGSIFAFPSAAPAFA